MADDRFRGHRRDERPVIALRDHVPGAFNAAAVRSNPISADEHAAAMFAPAHGPADAVHERCKSLERWQQTQTHRVGKDVEGAVQALRHGASAHPHILQAWPKVGQHLEIRNVDQREAPLIEWKTAWRRDDITAGFDERVMRPAVRHLRNRLAGVACDRAHDIETNVRIRRRRNPARYRLETRHVACQPANYSGRQHRKTAGASEHKYSACSRLNVELRDAFDEIGTI